MLGWTLWEGRTYQLVETTAPEGYERNEAPTEFILSDAPSSQLEYDLTGDSVTAWNTRMKTDIPVRKKWDGPAADAVTVRLLADNTQIQNAVLSEETGWQYTFEKLPKYDPDDGHVIQYEVKEDPPEGYEPHYEVDENGAVTITNTVISTETETEKHEQEKPTEETTPEDHITAPPAEKPPASQTPAEEPPAPQIPAAETPETKSQTAKTTVTRTQKTETTAAGTPKTGDASNIILWVFLLLISGGLLFWFIMRRKRS